MARRVENQLLLHSHTGPVTGDLLDILKKKKCKGHVTKEKIPPSFYFKKKKQTNKQKQKQKKQIPGLDF